MRPRRPRLSLLISSTLTFAMMCSLGMGARFAGNAFRLETTPQAADRLQGCEIDRFTRGWEKPSDHVPVWIELKTD